MPSGNFDYSLAIANNQIDLLVQNIAVSAAWNTAGDGLYSDSTKWDPTQPPSGPGQVVTFGIGTSHPINGTTVPSGAIAVTVDGAYTAGSLVFDNSAVHYTLASDAISGHGLTLDNGGAANGSFTGAVVGVNSGSHTIATHLTLADSAGTTFDLASGTSLSVTGVVSGSGANQSLTLTGGGTLTLGNTNTYSGGTTVAAGTLQATAFGALGSGPLAVNSTGSATIVNVTDNQSVGGLSSTISGGGSATIDVAAGKTLSAGPASGSAAFGGALVLAAGSPGAGAAFTKTGAGTEVLTAAPQLGNGSALNVGGGTLQVNVASGAASVGTSVTAEVSGGSTLELAGSVSALGTATAANRVDVTTNSTADTLLVSGGNQIVGGIEGSGTVQVNASTSLTANHITAGALVIGGDAAHSATLNIAPSDSFGDPTGSTGFALAGSLAPSAATAAGGTSSASLMAADSASSAAASLSVSASAGGNLGSTLGSGVAAVPEPSTLLLLVLGSLACLLALWRRSASIYQLACEPAQRRQQIARLIADPADPPIRKRRELTHAYRRSSPRVAACYESVQELPAARGCSL